MDLDGLAKHLEELEAGLEKESSRIAIACGKTVLQVLTRETPVDTSQAISNWLVSIGETTSETIDPYFVGTHGSTFVSSSQRAYEAGSRNMEAKGTFEDIYIVNNLNYIESLEAGKSIQNSQFVFRAILIGKEVVKGWNLFDVNEIGVR